MPTDVIMPALELAQVSGKVLRWLKAPGDAVTKGEPIVEIETDKVTVEIEAPASGVLRELERRHDDVRRHHARLQSARAASKTVVSFGTVRSSSTGENGTGTSIAPMRLTGASR